MFPRSTLFRVDTGAKAYPLITLQVDITMKAAKENEAVTVEQYARESIRVARTTRELLKRFASAYRLFHDMEDSA